MSNFLTWAVAAFIVYVLFFARSENEAYAYDDAEFYADDSVVAEYFGEVPVEHFGFFSSIGNAFKKVGKAVASVAKPALGVVAGVAGGKLAMAAGMLGGGGGGGDGGGAAAGGSGPVNVGPFNIQSPCPACVGAPCPACPACPTLNMPQRSCPNTKWNELAPQNVIAIAIMLVLMILAVRSFKM